MSANNFLLITKEKDKYSLHHCDADCGPWGDKFPEFSTLEEAVKAANSFMQENEVEYGLDIRI